MWGGAWALATAGLSLAHSSSREASAAWGHSGLPCKMLPTPRALRRTCHCRSASHSPSGRPASSTSSAACLEACRTATRPDSCTAGGSAAAAAAAGSLLLAGRSSSVSAAALTTSAGLGRAWSARRSCCCAGCRAVHAICALQAPGAPAATATAAVSVMQLGLTATRWPESPQPSRACRASRTVSRRGWGCSQNNRFNAARVLRHKPAPSPLQP